MEEAGVHRVQEDPPENGECGAQDRTDQVRAGGSGRLHSEEYNSDYIRESVRKRIRKMLEKSLKMH